ncbi:TonB family protein [Lysobacter enzymogenes]|uniref:TonB family protein n=1 Tax=Lysobacter enzymogenes TaxID=69 RepID=UPI001A97CA21|nr:TonB family protein [Lysobacter enzymogenes]QQP94249.1 TonB family protein [Lysobacter enzymogenes]
MKFVIEPGRIAAAGQGPGARRSGAKKRTVAGWGAALGLSLMMAGCGSRQPPADPAATQASAAAEAPPAETPAAAPLPPALDELDAGGLRERAARALREQRIHTPAGDSAVDYYLALRDKDPGQADVAAALTELQPYVVIAGEQALADADLSESQRLTGLLARMDPQAPALPRLRAGLRTAQAAQDQRTREDTERAAAARNDAATLARTQAAQRSAAANAALKAQANANAGAADEAAARASTPAAPIPAPPAQAAAPLPPPKQIAAKAMPRLIADASPRYPLVAMNRKLEGSVEVAFTIQPDGRTGAARVVSAEPAGVFEDAALAAVARLRFEPSGDSHAARRTLNFKLPQR